MAGVPRQLSYNRSKSPVSNYPSVPNYSALPYDVYMYKISTIMQG